MWTDTTRKWGIRRVWHSSSLRSCSMYAPPSLAFSQCFQLTFLPKMPDEEAFCVLVRLMDSYNLRSHYTAEMQGLQLRLFQFDRLVEEILPLLHTHFVRKGVKSSMYASQWFMTLFSYRQVFLFFFIILSSSR